MFKSYLLNSVAHFDKPDDQGVDPKIARDVAIAAERAKVNVTTVKIDEPKDDEIKEEDEQKEEDGEEETKDESGEETEEVVEEVSKEELKAQKKQERIDRKFQKEVEKRKELERKIADLEIKLAANPDKTLTEEDVKTQAKLLAKQERLIEDYKKAADSLADGAQKELKMKTKQFDALVANVLEELDVKFFPGEVVGALNDIDNGAQVLAHLLKNTDEMEEMFYLKERPAKLGIELSKLAAKLAKPAKQISKVPDAAEPLGGKPTGNGLTYNSKGISMDEYVQMRNADIAAKRANGKHNLR